MKQSQTLPRFLTLRPPNVDRWKRTPMINKSKSQGLPFPELLRRIQSFVPDCLPHRVKNFRSPYDSNLSLVFRHTTGVNRKISLRLHPVLHFYRQYAQFVLNPTPLLSLSTSLNQII